MFACSRGRASKKDLPDQVVEAAYEAWCNFFLETWKQNYLVLTTNSLIWPFWSSWQKEPDAFRRHLKHLKYFSSLGKKTTQTDMKQHVATVTRMKVTGKLSHCLPLKAQREMCVLIQQLLLFCIYMYFYIYIFRKQALQPSVRLTCLGINNYT